MIIEITGVQSEAIQVEAQFGNVVLGVVGKRNPPRRAVCDDDEVQAIIDALIKQREVAAEQRKQIEKAKKEARKKK